MRFGHVRQIILFHLPEAPLTQSIIFAKIRAPHIVCQVRTKFPLVEEEGHSDNVEMHRGGSTRFSEGDCADHG